MKQIFKSYYETLRQTLSEYDIDINEFYTYNDFLESLRVFRPFGIIAAFIYCQNNLFPEDIKKKYLYDEQTLNEFLLGDRTAIFEAAWNDNVFKTRLTALVEDLYEFFLSQ